MIRLTIEDSPYAFEVEFLHARADGPHAALGRRSTVAAITTCVIVAVTLGVEGRRAARLEYFAIGNAVCELGDQFSRREGRWKAFAKAVHQCGMLFPQRVALLDAYAQHDPGPPPREPHTLTAAEKTARWEAGWVKRKHREMQRGAGSVS